jgi:peptidoglycan/LPS O-acetylase OafA/YrhL
MQRAKIISQESWWKWLGIFVVVFPIYIWTQPRPIVGMIAIVAALVVAICIIQIILLISPFVEKHLSYLFLLSTITYEVYLIHYSVIGAVDGSYHGRYFAYPLVFVISISLAFLILMMSKPYERLMKRLR